MLNKWMMILEWDPEDTEMMDGIYIGLYTNVSIDMKKDEKFSQVNWHTRIK